MADDLSLDSGERETDHERRATPIEGIDRDNQTRAHPRLFMPPNRIKVRRPDLAPQRYGGIILHDDRAAV